MGFTLPNDVSGGTAAQHQQSAPDTLDFAILAAALNGDGVLTGCSAAAQGSPDMTYAVSAGTVSVSGTTAAVTAGNVTVTAANATNPRIDLIVVNSSGTKAVTAGTPAASPVPPAIPASSVVLYTIYVAALDTTMETALLTDKRCFVRQATKKLTSNETGATTATLANTSLSFAVSSGVYYSFTFHLIHQASVSTSGLKVGLTTPTTTRFAALVNAPNAADGVSSSFFGTINSSGDSVVSTNVPVQSVDYVCVVQGTILPSADGTLMVQYANEAAAGTVTMMQGSIGILTVAT